MNDTKYETRPVECWARMKELRRQHFRQTWEAVERGEVVIMGVQEGFLGYLAGMGNYANPSYGPYYTGLMRDPAALTKVLEAFEAKGHPREICSSMRCYIGQLYTGLSTKNPRGGTVRPDFIIQIATCHTMAQTGQLFAEYLGVPYLSIDEPFKDSPRAREYLVAQFHDGIEWMEKISGRKWDDEALIEGTKNDWECMHVWAQIWEEMKNIPAPLDFRQLWSLRLPIMTMRHKKEVVEYAHILLDEVKWRVKNKISACGVERIRLLHEGFPPYHHISVLKYPNQFGAVFVANENSMCNGTWDKATDGTWTLAKSLSERGVELRTRDDALRAEAELHLSHTWSSTWYPHPRPEATVKRAQDWHCDAAIFGLDRGCHGYQTSILETKRALQKAGIPTGTYEHSQSDPRDFSVAQITDRLDSFMESLGLTRLPGWTR